MKSIVSVVAAAAAALVLVSGSAVAASGAYGCPERVVRGGEVYVQGSGGVFFRLKPDLDVFFPLSDHFADRVAELSRVLARNGTKLVMLAVPARGTVMSARLRTLPLDVTMGFDESLAKTSYRAFVAKLRSRGVATVDLLPVLETKPDGTDHFMPVDHHWSSAGAEASARALVEMISADIDSLGLVRGDFRTKPIGEQLVVSQMRRDIQLFCNSHIPPNMVQASETLASEVSLAEGELDIFGSSQSSAPIALAGTSFSDVEAFNFAGFLSQYSGLDVANVAILGGNQFTSILSYVTSSAFVSAPPKFLIWENPVYNNLGEAGDQPFDELVAAAGGTCEGEGATSVPVRSEGSIVRARFSPPLGAAGISFKFDAGNTAVRAVAIDLTGSDGSSTPMEIRRSDRFRGNGRFFFRSDVTSLETIEIRAGGSPELGSATLTICNPVTN